MRMFVTGATGFIGSHLINELTQYHSEVYALRRKGSGPRIQLSREPIWIEGELDDLDELSLTGTDCLLHLAAHGAVAMTANWEDSFRVNVTSSLALWLRAVKAGVKNFIVVGSCGEYGSSGESYDFIPCDAPLKPVGPYYASKAAATMAACALAKTEEVKVWILRPFHVYGEGESTKNLYPQILEAARSGKDLNLTPGEQVRDFTPVKHAVRLIHGFSLLLSKEQIRSCFRISNLGTGIPRSLKSFVTEIWSKENGMGKLNFGSLPYRTDEVMRYVPLIDKQEQEAALLARAQFIGT